MDADRKEPNYFKEAFLNQYNLISLGGFAALGVLFPGFWYLGLATELAYMALVPTHPRYQRSIRSRHDERLLVERKVIEKDLSKDLSPEDRKRYLTMQRLAEAIRNRTEGASTSARGMLEHDVERLEHLEWVFLNMLVQRTRLASYLAQTDGTRIARDLQALERELATATSPRLAEVKRRNAEILRHRQSRLTRATEELEILEANIKTLEDTLHLLRDAVAGSVSGTELASQLDLVVASLQDNERLMLQMDSFIAQEGFDALPEERPTERARSRVSAASDRGGRR